MKTDLLERIRKAEAEATAGKWYWQRIFEDYDEEYTIKSEAVEYWDSVNFTLADVRLICPLRNHCLELVDRCEEAEAAVGRMQKHFDAAGDGLNLLALLDLYHDRAEAAEARTEAVELLFMDFWTNRETWPEAAWEDARKQAEAIRKKLDRTDKPKP